MAKSREPMDGHRSATPGKLWAGGLVLVVVGLLILLLMNADVAFVGDNWWALFFLIPSVAAFGRAVRTYRSAGRLTPAVGTMITTGLGIMLVGVIFLFGLDWDRVWPLFLVLVGIGAILRGLTRDRRTVRD